MRIKCFIKISYYDNNKIFYYVKNGFEHIKWYDNGQIKSQAYFKNGKRDGGYTFWYKNGQILEHRFYVNDKLNGEYIVYYSDGRILNRETYKDDKTVKEEV